MSSDHWEFWKKTDQLTKLSSELFCLPENAETRNNLVSLSNYLPLIVNLIGLMKPKLFCEIGVDDGNSTHAWSRLSQTLDCGYHAVDPTISRETAASFSSNVEIFKEKSLQYLDRKYSPDIYFIDGDHNYYTVISELGKIEENRLNGQSVLVFMDDVGWPFARRDLYYNKSDIPAEYCNESSRGLKLSPGSLTHQSYGLPLGGFEVSISESSDKNGVLTAVEDFLQSSPGWGFIKIPSLYGFGILWRTKELPAQCHTELKKIADCFNFMYPFMGVLEFNRITLLSKIDQLGATHQEILGKIGEQHHKAIDSILKDKSEADSYIDELEQVIDKIEKEKSGLNDYANELKRAIDRLSEEKTVLNDYTIELKQAIEQLTADKKVADEEIARLTSRRRR